MLAIHRFCLLIVFCLGAELFAAERTVEVRGLSAGPSRSRVVSWSIPEAERRERGWTVRATGASEVVPSQLSADGTQLVWIVAVGEGHEDLAKFALAATSAESVTGTEPSSGPVVLGPEGRPIVTYQAGPRLPEGVPEVYRRSGHLHPLQTPSGLVVTDEFPADHLHQHAIFFAWVNTTFRGHHVDFWNQSSREGNVEHVRLASVVAGPVFSSCETELRHLDLHDAAAPVVVLKETLSITAYPLGEVNVVDLVSRQRAASEPLTIHKYHYGGFGVRGAASWGKECEYLTNEGKDRKAGDQQPARWVRVTGRVDGKPCGLAALCAPGNFRAPQPVRLHPSMPYFAFSACIGGEFEITAEKDYLSRYRMMAFDGTLSAETLDALWEDYAHPLIATELKASSND
jgi:hypothetical protein